MEINRFIFNYVADLPAVTNFIVTLLLLFIFPNIFKDLLHLSILIFTRISSMNLANVRGVEPPSRGLYRYILCYYFKNLLLLPCYPLSVRECKGRRFFSNHQISFRISSNFFLAFSPLHLLCKELFYFPFFCKGAQR